MHQPARSRPRVAITIGDINGIGPEVLLKSLADVRLLKYMDPLVVGSLDALRAHAEMLGLGDLPLEAARDGEEVPAPGIPVLDLTEGSPPVIELGRVREDAGRLAMRAVERAVELARDGAVDAMVTAPISKESIALAGYAFPGHTEFIADRLGTDSYTMMMVSGDLRVGLVTTHLPLREVSDRITREAILDRLRIISGSLKRDFGVSHPQIAVLGLNPHAGDGGVIGREEIEIIRPAIREACAEGILASGPFPADGFFALRGDRRHHAVLAMYHDQGLVPFKTIAFNTGVNFTAGLPIVRTSPDHGTAFDIAGRGTALPDSMRSAVYLAMDVARRRVESSRLKVQR